MKTVVIYNDMGTNIEFFILDGDQSHLDMLYLNYNDVGGLLQAVVYDSDNKLLVTMLDKFPMLNEPFIVIVAGFAE